MQPEFIFTFSVNKYEGFKDVLDSKTGVYILRDEQNDFLYIGMSTNLGSRIKSHLWGSSNVKDHIHLVKEITVVFSINETAARLSEMLLINELRPSVNKDFLKDKNEQRYNDLISQRFELMKNDSLNTSKEPQNDELIPKLKMMLLERNIPQGKIAEIMNESKQTISLWANGHKAPSLSKAFRLAKILECQIADLWDYKDFKEE